MATLEIFDVQHGQCALLSSDAGAHMMIDCGSNGATGWKPSAMLNARGIDYLDELMITNYDEDHAADLVNVRRTVGVGILTRNPTVCGADLYRLKASDGMGGGIASLAAMTADFTTGVSSLPNYDGMTYRYFFNSYPADFGDENNLSLVVVMRWAGGLGFPGFSILFGGDMEVAGWRRLLARQDFVEEMRRGVTVFVASHHGRSNGYCRDLFDLTGLAPEAVVISDSGVQYATQETIADYRRHARGFRLGDTDRRVLTTRRDGSIIFDISPGRVTRVWTRCAAI